MDLMEDLVIPNEHEVRMIHVGDRPGYDEDGCIDFEQFEYLRKNDDRVLQLYTFDSAISDTKNEWRWDGESAARQRAITWRC